MRAHSGEPRRVAIVGCGEAGVQKHLRALRGVAEIEVTAVVDEELAAAQRAATAFGIPAAFDSLEAMLDDPRIDGVAVIVPPGAHASVACRAANAGKHVLVEKPLALSLGDAAAIVAAASEAKVVAMTGFHMRFHRLMREARTIVRSGALGRIRSIHSMWHSPRDDEGLPRWRWRRQSGGGALVEIGTHHIDLWQFLLGRKVRTIFAAPEHGTRDDEVAEVVAELEGGIAASASLSERTPHAITIAINGERARLEVDCLRFDGLRVQPMGGNPGAIARRLADAGVTLRSVPVALAQLRSGGDYLDSYRGLWRHFAATMSGAPAGSTLDDGVEALRVVIAATVSAEEGRSVEPADQPGTLSPAVMMR